MIDFHIHSKTSADNENEIEKIIDTAEEKGMKHICITNHYEPEQVKKGSYAFSFTKEDLEECKNKIKSHPKTNIDVSIGVELGYTKNIEPEITQFLEGHSFDYVLGSIHNLNNRYVSDPNNKGKFQKEEIYDYFDSLKNAIKLNKFDMIAHIDIFKRCIEPLPFEDVKPHWEEVADLLIRHGTGFEINTSKRNGENDLFYPERKVIELLVNKGVKKITIGSDSHTYERIGESYDQAISLLKDLGIKQIYYFKGRKAIPFEI